jgi:hypothetical protein
MQLETNPNETEREFALEIAPVVNALIWLTGLLDAIILTIAVTTLICIFTLCPPNREGADTRASAVTAQIPIVAAVIQANTKKYDPNDPKM